MLGFNSSDIGAELIQKVFDVFVSTVNLIHVLNDGFTDRRKGSEQHGGACANAFRSNPRWPKLVDTLDNADIRFG